MIESDTGKTNILIVDDTPENLSVLSKILTMKGYQVRPAINGEVAFTSIRTSPPDLILLDILMPKMNGFEVCRRLKADAATRDIPIIFISALDATADKIKAFQVGGVDYVTKPFQAEEVVARVETHLTLRKTQKRLQDRTLQLQNALDNVKTLSGLLPTCAKCKKIRDDRGYWNNLERYIEQHLDVLFSHGLCPDCLQDFYTEMEESRNAPQESSSHVAVSVRDGEEQRILLVDDSKTNLSVLRKILSQKPYHLQTAMTGELALHAVEISPPDLILLDVLLPDMDGYEICRRLKERDETSKIPIMFISALTETLDKMEAFKAGGVDYITKPFQPEEVLVRVQAHLALQQMQKELQGQNVELSRKIVQHRETEEQFRRQNYELFVLNRMSHNLQKCSKEEESYPILTGACQQLFPTASGTLFIRSKEPKNFHKAACWGTSRDTVERVLLDNLRECCTQDVDQAQEIRGSYLKVVPEEFLVYAPICHRGERFAVLALDFCQERSQLSHEEWESRILDKEILFENLSEYYALSLSNLRLRITLQSEAIHDPLTGLYNRRDMELTLQRQLYQAERRGSSLAIVLLDIDYFKKLNDNYGHDSGDEVLKTLSQHFKQYYRREDVICRYGGEEFLLILPDTPLETAMTRIQEFLKHVEAQTIPYKEHRLQITLSAGVAIFPAHGILRDELVLAADRALYQAKEAGRNQVVLAGSRA